MLYFTGLIRKYIEAPSSVVLENCFICDLIHGAIDVINSDVSINSSSTCFFNVTKDGWGACIFFNTNLDAKVGITKTVFQSCFTYSNEQATTEGQTVSVQCSTGNNPVEIVKSSISLCGRPNDSYDRRGIIDSRTNTLLENLNMSDSWSLGQSLYSQRVIKAKHTVLSRLFAIYLIFIDTSNLNFEKCNMVNFNCTASPFYFSSSEALFEECTIVCNHNKKIELANQSKVTIHSCYIVNVDFGTSDPNRQSTPHEIGALIKIGDVMEDVMRKSTVAKSEKLTWISLLGVFDTHKH